MEKSFINYGYDEELNKIEYIKLHPEYLPFIGSSYDEGKILLLGESHYIDNGKLKLDLSEWYYKSTDTLFENVEKKNRDCKDWFNTRAVLLNFLCNRRSESHSMFKNPADIIKEKLGYNICPTDSAALRCCAFLNYFQRPSFEEGGTIVTNENDNEIAFEVFSGIVNIINPDLIIFCSKKAYYAYESYASVLNNEKIKVVSHPTSAHWNKGGKQEFEQIIDKYFVNKTISPIADERITLLNNLFDKFYVELDKHNIKYEKYEGDLESFYDNTKLFSGILLKDLNWRIEIEDRPYICDLDNEVSWKYLPVCDMDKTEVTNFRNSSYNAKGKFARRNLYKEEVLSRFVEESVESIKDYYEKSKL